MNNNIELVLIEKTRKDWEEYKLQLDIYVIDLQHIWLLYLINKLDNIIHHYKLQPNIIVQKDIRDIIDSFAHYTQYHFSSEELLIRLDAYPNIEGHLKEHNNFIEQLRLYTQQESSQLLEYVSKIQKYLQDWLVNHINIEDRKLISYYKKQINIDNFFQKKVLSGEIELPKEIQSFYHILSMNDTSENIEEELIIQVKLIWNRYKLQTNIPIIDLQHSWLIYLITKLKNTLEIDTQKLRLSLYQSILEDVVSYVHEHFKMEEDLMQLIHYSDVKPHKGEHDRFLHEIIDIKEKFESSNERNSELLSSKLLKMLENWLYAHIVIHDQEFSKTCQNKKEEILQYAKSYIEKNNIYLKSKHLILYKAVIGKR